MRKISKVIITIIMVTLSFCNISFAVNLGEKNAGGIVVAIYQNKEYVAIGVTVDALQNGEVLEWSKWSNEDLITLKNRCDNNNFGRYWDDNKQGYVDYDWYTDFYQEFTKREDIIATGANTGTGDQDNVNYKDEKDMTDEDKKNAEEYKKQNAEIEKYKKYKAYQIVNYLEDKNNEGHKYKCPKNCYEIWKQTLRESMSKANKNSDLFKRYKKVFEETFGAYDTADGDIAIYTNPDKKDAKTSAGSLDDMISDADSFTEDGEIQYDEGALKKFSTILYNCFLAVGVATALVVGIVIGIKYMMGSIEEKATYKQMLLPYVVGCLVVFGAFGIWKIVVIILESM